jgi:glycosyltransferase involved in cell wall biosynthesis
LSGSRLGLARYRAARKIVAVSQFVGGTVVASGLPLERVEVVYDGVAVPPLPSQSEREAARRLWASDPRAPLIGCVGYLLPEKGQEALVRAMPSVLKAQPDCRLVLAGDGPCRSRLERLAGELRVAGSISFAGHVEDVSTVYRALDVFLFPSLAEPLGSSLLAAMAQALPAVGVARGAVPEIIQHGRDGLLVTASEPNEIATATLRLLGNPELAHALGAAARETIRERFSANRMVEDTLGVYGRL